MTLQFNQIFHTAYSNYGFLSNEICNEYENEASVES